MYKRTVKFIIALFLILAFVPVYALAHEVTLNIEPKTANIGATISLSGNADPSTFVSIKVLDEKGIIVYFDAVKSSADGSYSTTFKVPAADEGELTIVAGYDTNVATEKLNIVKGEIPEPKPADKTALNAKIQEAKNYKEEDYKEGWGAFDTALKTAQQVADNKDATQTEVDNALGALKEAIKGLVKKGESQGPGGGESSGGGGDDKKKEEKPEPKPDETEDSFDISDTAQKTVSEINGKTSVKLEVDEQKAIEKLEKTQAKELVIKADGKSDILSAEVPNKVIEKLAKNRASLIVESEQASYTLPADEVDLDKMAGELGVDKSQIKVNIVIAEAEKEKQETLQNKASEEGMELVSKTVEFKVEVAAGDNKKVIDSFKSYIKRTIVIDNNIDAKIATGVVLAEDGSVRPVPTRILKKGGKTIAEINRMSNSTYAVVKNKKNFKDTVSHWADGDICQLAARMVVNGVDKYNYLPEGEVTRAQFAAILTRALDLQGENTSKNFSDVKGDEWFAQNVNTAVAFGMIEGYPDGTFKPNASITRQEVASMVTRALDIAGEKQKSNASTVERFKDASTIGGWAKEAVARAVDNGIINGYPDGSFAPQQTCTRAEAAVMVKRMLNSLGFM